LCCGALDGAHLPVKYASTPRFASIASRIHQGSASLINEAVDLFDVPLPRRRTTEEGDLITVLSERVERLVERHRATRRAVDELGGALVERDRRIIELDAKVAAFERLRADLLGRIDALVAEVDRLATAGDERES
jgi:hypothetical protein